MKTAPIEPEIMAIVRALARDQVKRDIEAARAGAIRPAQKGPDEDRHLRPV
jgi:hypothetical protein